MTPERFFAAVIGGVLGGMLVLWIGPQIERLAAFLAQWKRNRRRE